MATPLMRSHSSGTQGFYFSRPVDRAEFGELLRDPDRISARMSV